MSKYDYKTLTYDLAVEVLCHYYHFGKNEASKKLDIELKCLPYNYAIDYIKETFEESFLNEHEKWLKQEIHNILFEVLENQFLLSPENINYYRAAVV